MSSQKDFTVAIIGGGVVGLVCAIGLAKAGIHVEVFEAAVHNTILLSCFMELNSIRQS